MRMSCERVNDDSADTERTEQTPPGQSGMSERWTRNA